MGPERTSEASQSPGDTPKRGPPGLSLKGPSWQTHSRLRGTALFAGTDILRPVSWVVLNRSVFSQLSEMPGCQLASRRFSVHSSFFRPGFPSVLQLLQALPRGSLATQSRGGWWASFAHFTDQETEAQSCSGGRLQIIPSAKCLYFPTPAPTSGHLSCVPRAGHV